MGGSILLREPGRVAQLVKAVRDAVPAEYPVTAKIRLGYENSDALAQIVEGVHEAGATELAIPARTKFDGYKPPAYWDNVFSVVNDHTCSKTIINGEIWTVSDSIDAMQRSACSHVMLGRGALSTPDLAKRILRGDTQAQPIAWVHLIDEVLDQFLCSDSKSPRHIGNRTKQWLAYLKRTYPEANVLFQRIRKLHDIETIEAAFHAHKAEDVSAESLIAVTP